MATVLLLGAVLVASDGPARISSYANPVIPGFYPDPSVVRVGDDYYLVTSSFEFYPGVPVFHSRDLVHWVQVGYALTRPSQLLLAHAGVSQGIFAPTIRHHEGTYYVITTNVSDGGNFYVTAQDPAGPWSDPIWVQGQGGIDPSLFFDEDGSVFFTSNGGVPDTHTAPGIYQSKIDVATGHLLSHPRLIWRGTGGRYPEGPHLYKIGGRYYLMISEGGTEYGHMVTIARADLPFGPFEAGSGNPILTHRNTQMDQPIQGTGHADLVEDHEGNWWMVFLAFRTVGGYFHHLGRETFLAPVDWDEAGWPVVNGGHPIEETMNVAGPPAVPVFPARVRDDFDGPLGFAWNYLRQPVDVDYSLALRPGWLTLHDSSVRLEGSVAPGASPTFVGRRQQHLRCRVRTRLDFTPTADGPEAGLTVFQNGHHRYDLGVRRVAGRREVFVRQTIGPTLSAVTAREPLDDDTPVVLEVRAEPQEYGFNFGSSLGSVERLGTAPTRYLSSEVAGGFTDVYFALLATGNERGAGTAAHFDWFDYEPQQ